MCIVCWRTIGMQVGSWRWSFFRNQRHRLSDCRHCSCAWRSPWRPCGSWVSILSEVARNLPGWVPAARDRELFMGGLWWHRLRRDQLCSGASRQGWRHRRLMYQEEDRKKARDRKLPILSVWFYVFFCWTVLVGFWVVEYESADYLTMAGRRQALAWWMHNFRLWFLIWGVPTKYISFWVRGTAYISANQGDTAFPGVMCGNQESWNRPGKFGPCCLGYLWLQWPPSFPAGKVDRNKCVCMSSTPTFAVLLCKSGWLIRPVSGCLPAADSTSVLHLGGADALYGAGGQDLEIMWKHYPVHYNKPEVGVKTDAIINAASPTSTGSHFLWVTDKIVVIPIWSCFAFALLKGVQNLHYR